MAFFIIYVIFIFKSFWIYLWWYSYSLCSVLFFFIFLIILMQLIPCAVLSLLVHPSTQHHIVNRISWAFCVYLEAVSVLPQLQVMQNTKVCWNLVKLAYFFVGQCIIVFHISRFTKTVFDTLLFPRIFYSFINLFTTSFLSYCSLVYIFR